MFELIKFLFDKRMMNKRIPVWNVLIVAGIVMIYSKATDIKTSISTVATKVDSANSQLQLHGRHLDRIDDALKDKLDIDTSPTPDYRTPRQQTFNSITNMPFASTKNANE